MIKHSYCRDIFIVYYDRQMPWTEMEGQLSQPQALSVGDPRHSNYKRDSVCLGCVIDSALSHLSP